MKKLSPKTISRALIYIRTLEGLIKDRRYLISSGELARMTGLSDVKIRKDISSFGKVGTPRIGYKTVELKKILEDFVLQDETVHIVLFGVGNLGRAILRYPRFYGDKIRLVAAFDNNRKKIGEKVNGVTIFSVDRAPEVIKKTHADIGIIAVTKDHSQEVADLMVLSGLKGIVNFSPTSISVPKSVLVKDMDFSIEFLALFCDARDMNNARSK